MGASEIEQWFAALSGVQQQTWLQVWADNKINRDVLMTLPSDRQPGNPGAWVTGPAYAQWSRILLSREFFMSEDLKYFLDVEYGRRASSEEA